MALELEIATYNRLLPDLMANEGEYVVIIGDRVMGIFEDREDAVTLGYEATKASRDFLVRQILEKQPVHFLPTMWRA